VLLIVSVFSINQMAKMVS